MSGEPGKAVKIYFIIYVRSFNILMDVEENKNIWGSGVST